MLIDTHVVKLLFILLLSLICDTNLSFFMIRVLGKAVLSYEKSFFRILGVSILILYFLNLLLDCSSMVDFLQFLLVDIGVVSDILIRLDQWCFFSLSILVIQKLFLCTC